MKEIEQSEFEKIYYSHRDKEIAKMIGAKSVHSVRRIAKEFGLKTKGAGYRYPDDKRKKFSLIFKE